eukprot:6156667-Amphidinium_carterae.1
MWDGGGVLRPGRVYQDVRVREPSLAIVFLCAGFALCVFYLKFCNLPCVPLSLSLLVSVAVGEVTGDVGGLAPLVNLQTLNLSASKAGQTSESAGVGVCTIEARTVLESEFYYTEETNNHHI